MQQYPLVFLNEYGQDEIAQYVTFRQVGVDTHIVGVHKQGDPEYSIPLHARAHPSPNFNRPGVKDYDLNIFHPSSTSRLLIDNTIIDLKDPGVVADVYRYRAHQSELKAVKHQQVKLDRREENAQSKLSVVERHLTYAAVCTQLIPHLNRIRPPSTNAIHIPRIFATQGPPNVKEGEDSLECRAVLGKWHRGGKPKFPYCLKCNESHPNHVKEECPLWKTCRWCLSTQHAHSDCPIPHKQCDAEFCAVPALHPNFGDRCAAMSSPTLCHELELACADYDDKLYQWEA